MDAIRILITCVATVAAYFICGIPFGVLVSARMAGIDVRKEGSGNIGMTNVARTVGGKAAGITFALDVGKGTLCVVLSRLALMAYGGLGADDLMPGGAFDWMPALVFLGCVYGHIFSPYLHFRGGKGISVGLGGALGFCWQAGLEAFAAFLAIAIPTGYISLGSLVAAATIPVFGMLNGLSVRGVIPVVIVGATVIWSHRENIGRLLRGEESRFSIRGKGKGDGDKR